MALAVTVLADGMDGKTGLHGLIKNPIGARTFDPSSFQIALQQSADAWAKAYFDYASQAMALDASPISLISPAPLSALFLAAMRSMTFLDLLPTNLVSFWMAPPVAFSGLANTGAVLTASGGLPILLPVIATMKATGLAGGNAMDMLITAVDAFTRLVIVQLFSHANPTTPIPTPLL
jgi:hypothetical protein